MIFITEEERIKYFQSRVRDKNLTKGQRIFAYARLRQLRHNEFKIFKIKSKYLFNTNVNDDHYVMTIKNDGLNNFLIVPLVTHEGTKEQILSKHNCLQISGIRNANFKKQTQLYPKIRSKRYHDNKNIKDTILTNCDYHIDLLQVNEIENFLYDNRISSIAQENRDLKNRWRKRRLRCK